MTIRSRTVLVCVACLVFVRAFSDTRAHAARVPALTVSLSIEPASPRAGVPITFTAAAAGDVDPIEYTFWLYDGSAWRCVREYDADPSYTWTPVLPGVAALQVWARRAGSAAAYEAWTGTGYMSVAEAAPPEPIRVSLATAASFPAPAGTPVTWIATATGGGGPLEFQFWRYDASGWKLVQPYGAASHYTWTPNLTDVGSHALQAWVRAVGSPEAYDEWRGTGFFEVAQPLPVERVVLQSDRVMPVPASQPVTWTADAAGRADVEFQFWRYTRSIWTMVQDYGTPATYSWTPDWWDIGFNAVQVWARRVGSSGATEAWTGTGIFDVVGDAGPRCSALSAPEGECFKPVPSYVSRDYLADLKVRSAADVDSRRRALVRWIWGRDRLPDDASIPPGALELDVEHPDIAALALPHLARVNRFRTDVDIPAVEGEVDAPIHSFVYEFVPVVRNDRLLVYNQGHIRDPRLVFKPETALGADNVLRLFLEQGYTVLVIQMPLLGDNADPRFPIFDEANPHDLLGARAHAGYNPLKAFLHPIRLAINYAQTRHTYSHVSMMGVSGGGWATTVYAALDTGVTASFPVAGSLPMALNQGLDDPCRHGMDWEQQQFPAGSDQSLGYLDLYLMASMPAPDGALRQQVQVLNRYDNCCFKGAKAENTYGEELTDYAAGLGGSYRMVIDATHFGHLISDCALRSFVLPALGHTSR